MLLGVGASDVLGNVHVGDGCQVGSSTLMIQDLSPHFIAVVIGSFIHMHLQYGSISIKQTLKNEHAENLVPCGVRL